MAELDDIRSFIAVTETGGFGRAAMALALIYVVGIAAAPFLPETRGKSLPS